VCEAVEALQPTAAWIAEHEAVGAHMRAAILTLDLRNYLQASGAGVSLQRRVESGAESFAVLHNDSANALEIVMNRDPRFALSHWARSLRLDPLRRQVHAFAFNKHDPKKRRLSLVTSIEGFRAIAARTGNYRPDENEPSFINDEALKAAINPLRSDVAPRDVLCSDQECGAAGHADAAQDA
jgi:RecT family